MNYLNATEAPAADGAKDEPYVVKAGAIRLDLFSNNAAVVTVESTTGRRPSNDYRKTHCSHDGRLNRCCVG